MRIALATCAVLALATADALAAEPVPIKALALVVSVPDGAGPWGERSDPGLSDLGSAALFVNEADDAVLLVTDEAVTRDHCGDVIAYYAQDQGATKDLASNYGLAADFFADVSYVNAPSALTACVEHGGHELVLAFSTYPTDPAARQRAALFSNAVAAAWIVKTDGYQNLLVAGEPVALLDRSTMWYGDASGALLRLWQDPMLTVTVERDQVMGIGAEAGATCASWMKALGQMYAPTAAPSFLTAPWYPDVVLQPGETAMMIACLPRRDGGNLLATIAYRGDTTAADFATGLTPVLNAIGVTLGVLPVLPAQSPPPPPTDLDMAPSGRSTWTAFAAPTLLAMYQRLTPAIDGVAASQGVAVGFELPAVGRRDEGGLATEAAALAGYAGSAGITGDGHAGVGYRLGGEPFSLTPLAGIGADMIDKGDATAPFHAWFAAYLYGGAIARGVFEPGIVVELRGAMIGRAGMYDETQLAGRAILLRGSKRKLSLEVSWRRFRTDNPDHPDADLLDLGIGVGR